MYIGIWHKLWLLPQSQLCCFQHGAVCPSFMPSPSPFVYIIGYLFHSMATCRLGCAHLCSVPLIGFVSQSIEAIPIEAMDLVKEPDSQESQPPAVPEAAPTSASTSPTPITETVTAEELEVLRQFRASSSRGCSPQKEAKIEKGCSEFLQALLAKNIGLSDLD